MGLPNATPSVLGRDARGVNQAFWEDDYVQRKFHVYWFLLLILLLAACGGDGASRAPVAPTGLTATPGEGKVTLRWQDKSDNETGFTIYRREAAADAAGLGVQQAPAFSKLGSVAENVTKYEDTTAAPGTLYRYGVTADGETGSSPLVATDETKPVAAGNRAPTADGQSFSTPEDTPVAVTLTGSDPDGDALSYTVVSAPAHGELSGDAPKLTYTPDENYSGKDAFTFTVSDAQATSAGATVTFTVGDVNDAPTANAQEVSTEEDTAVTITLTGSDPEGTALSFAIVKRPGKGSLGELNQSTGKVTYTPKADVNGQDGFTFTVSDGASTSAEATVTVNLGVVNDAPVAREQMVELDEDTPTNITLFANDPDGDKLTYEVVTRPAHGSLSGDAPKLTYTPKENYNGDDGFEYKANDGFDDSKVVTVSLTVKAVNDAPYSITLDTNTVAENQDAGTVVGRFSTVDVDTKDGFTYSLVEGEADNASFEIDGDQLETKTPFDYETKPEYSLRVEVNDGAGGTLRQSFTVTVTDLDDTQPEVTFNDPGELMAGKGVTLSGTATDNVGVASVEVFESTTSLGNATLNGNTWSLDYTPRAAGEVTLRVVTRDAAGNSAEASRSVTVVSTTYQGNVTIASQADVNALRDVTVITGSLTVATQEVSLEFSPLDSLEQVGGGLIIPNNPNLTDLSGFGKLQSVGYINIYDNAALASIGGFGSLTSVGSFYISNNAALTSLPAFEALESVGSFYIIRNAKLGSLSGFADLTSVNDTFSISYNAVLTSLSAFEALKSVGGSFYISSNATLASIGGFGSLTSVGSYLQISSNAKLETLNGFANLASVGGKLNISSNPALASIVGFNKLTSSAVYSIVSYNTALDCKAQNLTFAPVNTSTNNQVNCELKQP